MIVGKSKAVPTGFRRSLNRIAHIFPNVINVGRYLTPRSIRLPACTLDQQFILESFHLEGPEVCCRTSTRQLEMRLGFSLARRHKISGHEVAVELIKEKKRELKDGTSQRDAVSFLGSCGVSFAKLEIWCDLAPLVKANSSL